MKRVRTIMKVQKRSASRLIKAGRSIIHSSRSVCIFRLATKKSSSINYDPTVKSRIIFKLRLWVSLCTYINWFETPHYSPCFKHLCRSLNYCALSSKKKKRRIFDDLLFPFVVLEPRVVLIITHIKATEHRNDYSSEVMHGETTQKRK